MKIHTSFPQSMFVWGVLKGGDVNRRRCINKAVSASSMVVVNTNVSDTGRSRGGGSGSYI